MTQYTAGVLLETILARPVAEVWANDCARAVMNSCVKHGVRNDVNSSKQTRATFVADRAIPPNIFLTWSSWCGQSIDLGITPQFCLPTSRAQPAGGQHAGNPPFQIRLTS